MSKFCFDNLCASKGVHFLQEMNCPDFCFSLLLTFVLYMEQICFQRRNGLFQQSAAKDKYCKYVWLSCQVLVCCKKRPLIGSSSYIKYQIVEEMYKIIAVQLNFFCYFFPPETQIQFTRKIIIKEVLIYNQANSKTSQTFLISQSRTLNSRQLDATGQYFI